MNRAVRGAAFLRGAARCIVLLAGLCAAPLAGCDNYNLPFRDFYEGGGGRNLSSARAITGFDITSPVTAAGSINEAAKTIKVKVPYGTNLGALTPAITHTGASVSPPSGAARDFSGGPVTYTVTTADGTAAAYTVTVISVVPSGDITGYLDSYTGPDPVPLAVDLTLSPAGWSGLLDQIAAASPPRSVALDLSGCAMTGMTGTPGEFDPGSTTGVDRIVSLILPDAAMSIKAGVVYGTFRDFTALESVTGEHIAAVGDLAFYGTALASVSLPAAQTIGNGAFEGTALATLNLPAAHTIGDRAFYDCTTLTTLNLPAAQTIGEGAFWGCTALETVSLPAAQTVGERAFAGTALATLNLPAATSIGDLAFSGCTALETVDLPAAQTVGEGAFYFCTALATVSLDAVISIDLNAFYHCTALTTIDLPATPPALGAGVFQMTASGSNPLITIHVASPGTVADYTTAWGVSADTAAYGNETVYGGNHKRIVITDADNA